jgi:hypothetical protein
MAKLPMTPEEVAASYDDAEAELKGDGDVEDVEGIEDIEDIEDDVESPGSDEP